LLRDLLAVYGFGMNSCTFNLEKKWPGPVCGLDEAGRGPLAGPVMAACVYVPPEIRRKRFWADINDSKQLTRGKREELYQCIIDHCPYGIAESTVAEIDQLNILQASLLAMSRAMDAMVEKFDVTAEIALVDGNQKPRLPCTIQTVVQGDSISRSIAAASILAKVTRDRYMEDLCARHPGYGWSSNAGYGTAEHLEGLKKNGVTVHHRRSFAPVKSMLFGT